MLASILSFSPELADQVSEYCEKNSRGKAFSASHSLLGGIKKYDFHLLILHISPPTKFEGTLGLDSQELCGRRQDVITAARAVDDLDGRVDCPKEG